MKTRFLFPHKYKRIGWILAIPSFVLMLFALHREFRFKFLDYAKGGQDFFTDDGNFLFNIRVHNFTNEIGSLFLITGLLMIAFSRQQEEDERIAKLRLESLLWAVYVNSAWLMLSILFFYNDLFLNVVVYNLCTPLILFIIRFNVVMYKDRREMKKASL